MGKKSTNETDTFEYYLQHDRFINFLKSTKLYKGIYLSKEGIISLLFSSIVTAYIYFLISNFTKINITISLKEILRIILGGSFGMLGFLISGLAIITSCFDQKMISIIDKAQKYRHLLAIVFQFYYVGFIIGVLITISLLDYFLLFLPFKINIGWLILLTFINGYLFFYALIVTIMLLGTTIRLMNLRYYFWKKQGKNRNE